MPGIQYCVELNFQYFLSNNVSNVIHHCLEKSGKLGEHPLLGAKAPESPNSRWRHIINETLWYLECL